MTERFSDAASRRAFLTGLAAAGATATMASGLAFGQQATKTAAAKPKHHGVIDVHHHFWAPDYLKAQDDWEDAHHVPHAPPMQHWTPEVSLAEMDKSGVQTSILSLASISQGMWGLDPAAAHKVCLSCADYGAKVVADHKGRFGLFAPLNMLDADSSLKEAEYALDQAHADGIGVQSSYNGVYLGDESYMPIWEELNRRKAVVFVHGPNNACCSAIKDGPGMFGSIVEVTFDVTRTCASLLTSGALQKYPNIQWIIAYGGGTLPFVAGRINNFVKQAKNANEIAPNGVYNELKKFHVDTVNVTNQASMSAMTKFLPISNILYGTDYFYFNNSQLDELDTLHLSPKELAAIQSGNAKRLIPRLAKA
ncbi:MAG TPA: amidohydrolase family protein [Stellaceae bacterium]|nr:amidohydrolase family protein [Stellaceae bacterium]